MRYPYICNRKRKTTGGLGKRNEFVNGGSGRNGILQHKDYIFATKIFLLYFF